MQSSKMRRCVDFAPKPIHRRAWGCEIPEEKQTIPTNINVCFLTEENIDG